MTDRVPTDAVLLAAARQGDASAREALLVRHAPAVVRFARRLCDDPADADDVLQDTLVAAFRGLSDFRSDASLSTWLFAIARSYCVKKRRRSKFAPASVEPLDETSVGSASPAPDRLAETHELTAAVDSALQALAPKYREVLLLRDVEGLSASEVADALGIRVDAVKSRLHRARTAVRERLEPMLAPSPNPACPDAVQLFSRYLEGEIGPVQCAEMELHVSTCASCNAACQSLKRSLLACRATAKAVPEDVQERVRRALRGVSGYAG